MILYVSEKYSTAEKWGKTKLNKILWRADFQSFLSRGVPVTGRPYQRLPKGPAPVEMAPVLGEMLNSKQIRIENNHFSNSIWEERIIALQSPNLQIFSNDDLHFIDEAIAHYWADTAREVSDDSHGIAWESRADGDPMPYELAYISDRTLSLELQAKLKQRAQECGWKSA